MNIRHLLTAVLSVALLQSTTVMAQSHDASIANHQPHYYDVQEFGIDPKSVTFHKDIQPILQKSCQNCHRAGGGGPMSLISYDEVKPWAPVIRYRTAIRDRLGAMPPFLPKKISASPSSRMTIR